MKYSLYQLALPQVAADFVLFNLQMESRVLETAKVPVALRRHHYVLQSRKKKPQIIVFHLSGFFGNGPQSFQQKTLEETFVEKIMEGTRRGRQASALHVFVDGMTPWGGSQFINSDVFGRFSDHLQMELVPLIQDVFQPDPKCRWVVFGASSGGYGALHHVSLPKSRFDMAVAIAPDSDFQTSLLPELYKMSPYLLEWSTVPDIQKALARGEMQKKKNFFELINALAMTACYSPLRANQLQYPLDLKTGDVQPKIWKTWLQKDPVFFLAKRAQNLINKKIYLDVGMYDNFCLYFGTRKIRDVLKQKKIRTIYQEFPGTHFGLNERKMKALEWLKRS